MDQDHVVAGGKHPQGCFPECLKMFQNATDKTKQHLLLTFPLLYPLFSLLHPILFPRLSLFQWDDGGTHTNHQPGVPEACRNYRTALCQP